MTKHTPGPYHLDFDSERAPYRAPAVVTSAGDCVAIMDSCGGLLGPDQMVANAHLFAAAPDLLEACEVAEFWLQAERDNPGQVTPSDILRVLGEAIAMAKGGAR